MQQRVLAEAAAKIDGAMGDHGRPFRCRPAARVSLPDSGGFVVSASSRLAALEEAAPDQAGQQPLNLIRARMNRTGNPGGLIT